MLEPWSGRSFDTRQYHLSPKEPGMFTTTVKRIVVTTTAVLVTAAAPSTALADFSFHKYVDKSSPTIHQNVGGGTSAGTTPPAK